jgi:hypothetical protein
MLTGLHRQHDAMEDVFVVNYVDNNISALARMARNDAWVIGRSVRPLQRHPSQ